MEKQSTRKGATIERHLVLRKITQLEKKLYEPHEEFDIYDLLAQLRKYLKTRVPRFKKKAGGL